MVAHPKKRRKDKSKTMMKSKGETRSRSTWKKRQRGPAQMSITHVEFDRVLATYLDDMASLGATYIGFTVTPKRRLKQHQGGRAKRGAKKTAKANGDVQTVAIVTGFLNWRDATQFEWHWNAFVNKKSVHRRKWKCPNHEWLKKIDAKYPKKGCPQRALAFLRHVFYKKSGFKWGVKSLALSHPLRKIVNRPFRIYYFSHRHTSYSHQWIEKRHLQSSVNVHGLTVEHYFNVTMENIVRIWKELLQEMQQQAQRLKESATAATDTLVPLQPDQLMIAAV